MTWASAIAAAIGTAQAVAGASVTYRRGGATVLLTAVKTAPVVELADADGATIEGSRIDWIVTAAELILSGAVTEPAEGDQIDATEGGVTKTYEAMPVGTDAAFRPLDPAGKAWRIHTKLVAVA